jgi:hypothetical protein
MLRKEVWECIDGSHFDTQQDAGEHEEQLLARWMCTAKVTPQDIIDACDNTENAEFFGTMRHMAETIFQEAAERIYR